MTPAELEILWSIADDGAGTAAQIGERLGRDSHEIANQLRPLVGRLVEHDEGEPHTYRLTPAGAEYAGA